MAFISSHLPFIGHKAYRQSILQANRLLEANNAGNDDNNNEADEEEFTEKELPAWRTYAKMILPHVGLILLSFVYIVGGAFAFYHLEGPNEVSIRDSNLRQIAIYKEQMLNDMWNLVNSDTPKAVIEATAAAHVDNVTRMLFDAFDTHFITAKHLRAENGGEDEHSWTYTTALFFTATLLTTIGYGNLVPVTLWGRMFCVLYALFGVPLILITVADIGKFMSEQISKLYERYKKARLRWLEQSDSKREFLFQENQNNQNNNLMSGLEESSGIPMSLITIILLGYIAIGAVLLGLWEKWDFFTGFYFTFITMTTVGFGDIVPLNKSFFVVDLLYIIIGLAITTMCIDLVGIQYIHKIHYVGRAMKDARFAIVNVGGKMVHVPDIMRYASVLQQKYGKKPAEQTDEYVKGSFIPQDIHLIKYIDYT
ncbi:unnamed protein product, partial [Mesorhabditis belari]|uniref:Potassium channel domain-containing protein n=1 Tax=Mesorhabditis belari TaxID=2138241 RepID=A0AAF3EBK8_9BILA